MTKHKINAYESSVVEIPEGLMLLSNERLIVKHSDFYLSNKRIISHKSSFFGAKTVDYRYDHISSCEEIKRKPFVGEALFVSGCFLVFSVYLKNPVMFMLGACALAAIYRLWPEKSSVILMHQDGDSIKIPDVDSETGADFLRVLRTKLFK